MLDRLNLGIIALLSLSLTACGYHLRGAYDLPKAMKSVYLDGGSNEFREQFVSALQSAKGTMVASPDKAKIIVRVFDDEIERRVLSLGQGGRSNDIELAGSLAYQIENNKKGILVPREPISFKREFFMDQQVIIAKSNEENVIRKEMYSQVVRSILNRARSALEGKPK